MLNSRSEGAAAQAVQPPCARSAVGRDRAQHPRASMRYYRPAATAEVGGDIDLDPAVAVTSA
jgi:hypothetical protein